ncbi:MAG TPA: cysteine--tRNA ligase [Steroidobacteraceae bacterium]|nr:cysteine--tRNA ligase [Steroidobacteraceae bacterium]
MIRIFNSLTGEKEALTPIKPGHIGMYVCGITVYDYIHIGHARMLTVFDMVQRYLRYRGYQVTYVRNITDIDDKIIKRAAERGQTIDQVTEYFIDAMNEDAAALGLQKPDVEPRATQHVGNIIKMIQQLLDRGYAYVAANGDVMYAVAKFDEYGRLSGKVLADLRAGARVEVDESKRDPLDFVLWKSAKPGEPAWDSPWGKGRPGWHIECSAMSTAILGLSFDIHGGGIDLKFPHHENEIAQTRGATGAKFVNVWMHNGFVNIDDEKMSKSLGNFFTVREVLPKVRHPEVMRYFLLASHYRGPINYSIEPLEQADIQLNRLYTALRDLPTDAPASFGPHTTRFIEAMDDDFNTPEALAVLQTLTREINTARDAGKMTQAAALGAELRVLAGVLGLAQLDPEVWFRSSSHVASPDDAANDRGGSSALSNEEVQRLVDARAAARAAKNWAESDRLRDTLAAAGIIVEDKPGGKATWRRK